VNFRAAICWLLCACLLLVGQTRRTTSGGCKPTGKSVPSCCAGSCACAQLANGCGCERQPKRDKEPAPAIPAGKLMLALAENRVGLPRGPSAIGDPPRRAEHDAGQRSGTQWRGRPRYEVLGVIRV
jgi:hypothetical protein